MQRDFTSAFATALLDPAQAVPEGLISHASNEPRARFAVYRNNVMVGLVGALEARFPATRRIVGAEFFAAMAHVFATAHPPHSPLMMFYGDTFANFIAGFEPAAEVPYLADVARLEAARTRAYHAADAEPLGPEALANIAQEALSHLHFSLHPSLEIISSAFPIVTIWAMNAGDTELAPVTDWQGEDAIVARPHLDVEVRILPSGGKIFLQNLAAGAPLARAADAAFAGSPEFDLSINLAALFGIGLVVAPRHDLS